MPQAKTKAKAAPKAKPLAKGKAQRATELLVTYEEAIKMANASSTLRNKKSRWGLFLDWIALVGIYTFPIVPRVLTHYAAQLAAWDYRGSSIKVICCTVLQFLLEPTDPGQPDRLVPTNLRHVATVEDEMQRVTKREEATKVKPAKITAAWHKAGERIKAISNWWAQTGTRLDTLISVQDTDARKQGASVEQELWTDKIANVRGRKQKIHCNCTRKAGVKDATFCPIHCAGALKTEDFPLKKVEVMAAAADTSSHGYRRLLALKLREEHEKRVKAGNPGLKVQAVATFMGWEVSERKATKKEKKNMKKEKERATICGMWDEYAADYHKADLNNTPPIASALKAIKALEDDKHDEMIFKPPKKWKKEIVETKRSRAKAMAMGKHQEQNIRTEKKSAWRQEDSDKSDFEVSDSESSEDDEETAEQHSLLEAAKEAGLQNDLLADTGKAGDESTAATSGGGGASPSAKRQKAAGEETSSSSSCTAGAPLAFVL